MQSMPDTLLHQLAVTLPCDKDTLDMICNSVLYALDCAWQADLDKAAHCLCDQNESVCAARRCSKWSDSRQASHVLDCSLDLSIDLLQQRRVLLTLVSFA